MIEIINKKDCHGCHACETVCPKNCIKMESDEEGFWYPVVDQSKCDKCGLCIRVCSTTKSVDIDINEKTIAYGGKNLDRNIQIKSSSGGIFTAIASKIIDEGGIVFGAAFDKNWDVHHILVDKKEDLYKLRGSKYVQSKLGNTYKEAKEALDNNKKVLFSGTPCQVGSLKSFLQREYDNLLTVDVICRGVPSPMVWSDYVKSKESDIGGHIKDIQFRQKDEGWNSYILRISNEFVSYKAKSNRDPYMIGYLRNLYLRPSCYHCHFKSVKRCSDITLADYWSVQTLHKELYDYEGTSYILAHSDKGKKFLGSLTNIEIVETKLEEAIYKNISCVKSAERPRKREQFFRDYKSVPFEENVKNCTKIDFVHRVYGYIKRNIKQ